MGKPDSVLGSTISYLARQPVDSSGVLPGCLYSVRLYIGRMNLLLPCRAVRVPALPSRGAAPPCLRPATVPTTAASSLNLLSPATEHKSLLLLT